jgi:hypothetical protein
MCVEVGWHWNGVLAGTVPAKSNFNIIHEFNILLKPCGLFLMLNPSDFGKFRYGISKNLKYAYKLTTVGKALSWPTIV